jgi:transcription elongation factor Elf1
MEYTIAEEYTLPSKGLVYNKKINPNVKLRSMTTEEEMKRLGNSELPYKLLSEIIDDCMISEKELSSYDMCIGDYQFLLHKLRVVTYGPEYRISAICPVCGNKHEVNINLDNLEVQEYSEELNKYLDITLPRTKKRLKLRLQTPRLLDEIKKKTNELAERASNIVGEPAFLFTLQSVIERVDGEELSELKLEKFVRSLPMQDANYILKSLDKIEVGLNCDLKHTCKKCKQVFSYVLPITGEFFGPSID